MQRGLLLLLLLGFFFLLLTIVFLCIPLFAPHDGFLLVPLYSFFSKMCCCSPDRNSRQWQGWWWLSMLEEGFHPIPRTWQLVRREPARKLARITTTARKPRRSLQLQSIPTRRRGVITIVLLLIDFKATCWQWETFDDDAVVQSVPVRGFSNHVFALEGRHKNWQQLQQQLTNALQ